MSTTPSYKGLEEIKSRIRRIPELCFGCCLCEKICPSDATHIEVVSDGQSGVTRKLPRVDESKCTHCGHCASVCVSGAIEQEGFDDLIEKSIDADTQHLVFFCKSLNQGPNPVAAGGMPFPQTMPLSILRMRPKFSNVRLPERTKLIEVRCAGRIGARKVYDLLARRGMRSVLIFACPPENCSYQQGAAQLSMRLNALDVTLRDFGIDLGRFHARYVQPKSAEEVRQAIEEFVSGVETSLA